MSLNYCGSAIAKIIAKGKEQNFTFIHVCTQDDRYMLLGNWKSYQAFVMFEFLGDGLLQKFALTIVNNNKIVFASDYERTPMNEFLVILSKALAGVKKSNYSEDNNLELVRALNSGNEMIDINIDKVVGEISESIIRLNDKIIVSKLSDDKTMLLLFVPRFNNNVYHRDDLVMLNAKNEPIVECYKLLNRIDKEVNKEFLVSLLDNLECWHDAVKSLPNK